MLKWTRLFFHFIQMDFIWFCNREFYQSLRPWICLYIFMSRIWSLSEYQNPKISIKNSPIWGKKCRLCFHVRELRKLFHTNGFTLMVNIWFFFLPFLRLIWVNHKFFWAILYLILINGLLFYLQFIYLTPQSPS